MTEKSNSDDYNTIPVYNELTSSYSRSVELLRRIHQLEQKDSKMQTELDNIKHELKQEREARIWLQKASSHEMLLSRKFRNRWADEIDKLEALIARSDKEKIQEDKK
jgi:ABC-type molybdate transport system substrate-binding protein